MSESNASVIFRQCHFCRSTPDKLLSCSGCKRVYYCNSQCQNSDWRAHKAACRYNSETSTRTKADAKAARAQTDSAVDVDKLRLELKKWYQIQQGFLAYATANALKLKTADSKVTTHCIQFVLQHNSSTDIPKARFDVLRIDVVEIKDILEMVQSKNLGEVPVEVITKAQTAAEPIVVLLCGKMVNVVRMNAAQNAPEHWYGDENWESAFRQAIL